MADVQRRQLVPIDDGGRGDQIVHSADGVVAAVIGPLELTGAPGDCLGHRFGVKGGEQAPDFSAFAGSHAAGHLGDGDCGDDQRLLASGGE